MTKLSTAFLLWLYTAVLIIGSMCEPARATTTSYAVRVYTFAPKAELSTFVDWDTSSPVATDGHGNVAFVNDAYLDQFSAVVWSADGTVRTIASPRVDMDKAFRIYNIWPNGRHGYEGARIESLVFFRGNLAVTNMMEFDGAYGGIERGVWIRHSGSWSWLDIFDSNDPLDHAVAASDGTRLALVSDNSSGFEPSSGSPPHYWDPQSGVYDGKRLRRLGYWTVTSISGDYLAGYDWYTDPVAQARSPNVSVAQQRVIRWHNSNIEVVGLGVALGVNAHGVVVGAGQIKYPFMCPMVFSSIKPTCLINRYGIAYSIANDGTIVGFFRDDVNGDHAFVARGGRVLDLNQLVPRRAGRALQRAFVIDSSDRVVAYGTEAGRNALFVLEPK